MDETLVARNALNEKHRTRTIENKALIRFGGKNHENE